MGFGTSVLETAVAPGIRGRLLQQQVLDQDGVLPQLGFRTLLGGSWVVISSLLSPLIGVITIIPLLITNHP